MDENESIATGWWCNDCEFFETENPTGRCSACGCAGARHVAVSVVAR